MKIEFFVKWQHIKLLEASGTRWYDCEFGAPGIDCKRPYGNKDVIEDMIKLLGIEYDEVKYEEEGIEEALTEETYNWLNDLHYSTETVLQILLDNCKEGIKEGKYVKDSFVSRWKYEQKS